MAGVFGRYDFQKKAPEVSAQTSEPKELLTGPVLLGRRGGRIVGPADSSDKSGKNKKSG